MAANLPPSGEQHELRLGRHCAVATEVGGTLRSYTVGNVHVLDGFAIDERVHRRPRAGAGPVAQPSRRRPLFVRGSRGPGRARRAGERNAIHGLVRWLPWRAVSRTENAVTLACVLHPNPDTRGGSISAWSIAWR